VGAIAGHALLTYVNIPSSYSSVKATVTGFAGHNMNLGKWDEIMVLVPSGKNIR